MEFLNYAASKGVEVFYITNRKTNEMEATIKNLQKEGFPMADTLHVIPRTDVLNKESRRQRVAQNHKIVLLAGDNLNDFAEFWEKQSPWPVKQLPTALRRNSDAGLSSSLILCMAIGRMPFMNINTTSRLLKKIAFAENFSKGFNQPLIYLEF